MTPQYQTIHQDQACEMGNKVVPPHRVPFAYVLNLIPYTGKRADTDVSKTTQTVLDVAHDYLHLGHHLFMNNYYMSIEFGSSLSGKDTLCCGTVNSNRFGLPADVQKTAPAVKNLERGQSLKHMHDGIPAITWMDTRVVNLLMWMDTRVVNLLTWMDTRVVNLLTWMDTRVVNLLTWMATRVVNLLMWMDTRVVNLLTWMDTRVVKWMDTRVINLLTWMDTCVVDARQPSHVDGYPPPPLTLLCILCRPVGSVLKAWYPISRMRMTRSYA